ncbi:hypothetical protein DFH28DRAFT_318985 [Melampsora americana]|nr:hypothetical protein DFH28DRAFT_318985 [Melampsora americana]
MCLEDDEPEWNSSDQIQVETHLEPTIQAESSTQTQSTSSLTDIIPVTPIDEPEQVILSSSPTSNPITDQEVDDQDPDPDEIEDLPPAPITPLTPSRSYYDRMRSSSSCSRVSHLRNRSSWLSKQTAFFEELDRSPTTSQTRSSLPHPPTSSCSNACHQTHLPIPDSFRFHEILKPSLKSKSNSKSNSNSISRPVSIISNRSN